VPRPKKNTKTSESNQRNSSKISLRELAAHLNLSPAALSLVLNEAPAANAIPQETKDRIFAAAENTIIARIILLVALRAQRSLHWAFGPELSEGYSAMVLSGVENVLLGENIFIF
jgi:LacI family transcriptional regulator